jgi:DNA-binding transcriptional MocR family regulator
VRYLARGTGISRSAVERAITWLREAGLIEQKKFPAAEAKLDNPISRWRYEYRVAPEILRFIYRLVDADDDVAPEPTILDPELWVSEPMAELLYPSQGPSQGRDGPSQGRDARRPKDGTKRTP